MYTKFGPFSVILSTMSCNTLADWKGGEPSTAWYNKLAHVDWGASRSPDTVKVPCLRLFVEQLFNFSWYV